MNKVLLSGRLTETPELKATQSGVSVCTFCLAVQRATKDEATDFVTIVAWRQTAEFASRYLGKGRKVIVEGEIRTRNYDDKDGKRRKVTEVVADRIEFADSKQQESRSGKNNAPSGGNYPAYNDDLPFN